MRFLAFSALGSILSVLHAVSAADSVPFERLSRNDSILVIVDHQVGLFNLARDFDPTIYFNNMIAHAALGKLFEDVPVIMTTSVEDGPNGPLPQEVLNMYPDVRPIKRHGEINAWDNAEFRNAIKATGRKQIILAGIVTDVCTTFLALSLRAEGYSVWANVESSGTINTLLRDVSNSRMEKAGVQLVGIFSIVADLWQDWRNTPGADKIMAWFSQYYPAYSIVSRVYNAARPNGTVASIGASTTLA